MTLNPAGARTSTMLQRLPYLPVADAYVSENGGRIFWHVSALNVADLLTTASAGSTCCQKEFVICALIDACAVPRQDHTLPTAAPIAEDLEWRHQHTSASEHCRANASFASLSSWRTRHMHRWHMSLVPRTLSVCGECLFKRGLSRANMLLLRSGLARPGRRSA